MLTVSEERRRSSVPDMPADKATMKTSEHRRSNKPIMEKRRRARINSCLDELKNLLLEAMKKDPARHSKLEKADILEMTVKHLQNLQRQQMALAVAADPTVVTKYRAGFNECAEEVSRYVSRVDGSGIDPSVRQRLLSHLASCLNGLSTVANLPSSTSPSSGQSGVSSSTTALQLIPSRLPNGDVAFLLPGPGQMIPIYQHHTYVATPQGAPDSTTSSLTVSTSPSNHHSSSSSSCSSVSSSAVLSPCGSLRSSSSSPGVVSSPGVCNSPGVLSPGDAVKVEEVEVRGGGCGGRGLDEEEEDMSPHLQKQQHGMVDRSVEMLMPVNLSKDADKMWRPW